MSDGSTPPRPATGTRTDGLSDFQQRRLDLADMLRAMLPIAHARGDEPREQEIRVLLTRLAAGKFQLAVAGQFSRGKTTLMNALLGGAYLPMGALPMTSVVTTVRYGERTRALVRSHASGLPVEVPVTELARFVAQSSIDRVAMQVASVEVELPAELLRLGFELVDTPGVGSAIAANTAVTLRYLPQADAVVFVTGFDSPLTAAEAAFLASAAQQAGKVFLVVNKRDLVSGPDAAQVTEYVQRWARQNVPAVAPQVFGLSALDGLESQLLGDDKRLADSGINSFRAALIRFLTTEQGRTSLSAVAAAVASLVGRQQRDLRAGSRADGGHDPAVVMAEFDARMRELEADVGAVGNRIASRLAASLPGLLAERGKAWRASLRDLIEAAVGSAEGAGGEAQTGEDQLAARRAALEAAGRDVVPSWLEQRTAEVREDVIAMAAEDIDTLRELARSPRERGAALAGLATFAAGRTGWSIEDLPELLMPGLKWAMPDLPPRRRQRRARGTSADSAGPLLSDVVAAAVGDLARQVGEALPRAASDWARRLAEQAARETRAEAAQFRQYLSTPASRQDLAVLEDLGGRLASYRSSLASWVPSAAGVADDPVGLAPAPAPAAACPVCEEQERALTDFLIRSQFLLATSEDEQVRHAEAGGFCPLHTWQYAHLASPVGISAGNARLASLVASELTALGSEPGTAEERARVVSALSAASVRACGACAVLAGVERQATASVVGLPAPDAAPLCLRHLAMALRVGPSEAVGGALIAALAHALQRASTDMRSYALKREALRRGLITAAEDRAHGYALRLLAGHPALARPWQPEDG